MSRILDLETIPQWKTNTACFFHMWTQLQLIFSPPLALLITTYRLQNSVLNLFRLCTTESYHFPASSKPHHFHEVTSIQIFSRNLWNPEAFPVHLALYLTVKSLLNYDFEKKRHGIISKGTCYVNKAKGDFRKLNVRYLGHMTIAHT